MWHCMFSCFVLGLDMIFETKCFSDGFVFKTSVVQQHRRVLLVGDSLVRGVTEDNVDVVSFEGARVEDIYCLF